MLAREQYGCENRYRDREGGGMRTTCLLKASAILLPVGQWEGRGPFACDISCGSGIQQYIGEWINEFERERETQLVKNVLAARDSPFH